MALKSGGTLPGPAPLMDANQAVALLATMHHWSATKVNRSAGEQRTGYIVTVTHGGRRVSAFRATFLEAVTAAMVNLRKHNKPRLRLAE